MHLLDYFNSDGPPTALFEVGLPVNNKEDDMTQVILADRYREEIEVLKNEVTIIGMAIDVWQGIDEGAICGIGDIRQDDGGPRYAFMMQALEKYMGDGGDANRSLGGVARAVFALLDEWDAASND